MEASVRSEVSADELKDVMEESVVKEILGLLQVFEAAIIDVAADVVLSNEQVRSCLGRSSILSATTGLSDL